MLVLLLLLLLLSFCAMRCCVQFWHVTEEHARNKSLCIYLFPKDIILFKIFTHACFSVTSVSRVASTVVWTNSIGALSVRVTCGRRRGTFVNIWSKNEKMFSSKEVWTIKCLVKSSEREIVGEKITGKEMEGIRNSENKLIFFKFPIQYMLLPYRYYVMDRCCSLKFVFTIKVFGMLQKEVSVHIPYFLMTLPYLPVHLFPL